MRASSMGATSRASWTRVRIRPKLYRTSGDTVPAGSRGRPVRLSLEAPGAGHDRTRLAGWPGLRGGLHHRSTRPERFWTLVALFEPRRRKADAVLGETPSRRTQLREL